MTNAKDFPVSTDAFQKSGAGGDSFGPRPFGFVLKLSAPDGWSEPAALLWARLRDWVPRQRPISHYTILIG